MSADSERSWRDDVFSDLLHLPEGDSNVDIFAQKQFDAQKMEDREVALNFQREKERRLHMADDDDDFEDEDEGEGDDEFRIQEGEGSKIRKNPSKPRGEIGRKPAGGKTSMLETLRTLKSTSTSRK